MNDTHLISQDVAEQQIARSISLFMGFNRKYSVKEVSMATGIAERTLSSYIGSGEDRRTPAADKMLLLMGFFGDEFTSKVLSAVNMGAHQLVLKHEAPMAVVAALAAGCSAVASYAADGIFDHQDRAKLEPIADRLIATLQPFASRKLPE